jgi:predicted nucleic acid-binding protein
MTYFFDSYALFEIIFGNENYAKKTNNIGIITTKLNLLELHYHILLRQGEDAAEQAYAVFQDTTIELDDSDIKAASRFKAVNRKLKFSYADCLGYVIAKRNGVKFLTGDNAFKGMENVEFVK